MCFRDCWNHQSELCDRYFRGKNNTWSLNQTTLRLLQYLPDFKAHLLLRSHESCSKHGWYIFTYQGFVWVLILKTTGYLLLLIVINCIIHLFTWILIIFEVCFRQTSDSRYLCIYLSTIYRHWDNLSSNMNNLLCMFPLSTHVNWCVPCPVYLPCLRTMHFILHYPSILAVYKLDRGVLKTILLVLVEHYWC